MDFKIFVHFNKKGQGLIEYLIIVAIVAVGSISVIKVVGANLNIQFSNVAQALGGTNSQKQNAYEVPASATRKKDLSSFFDDAVNSSGPSKASNTK
ncbi:MAG TPA: hypothetical protein PLJ21_02005 [Pseudobdellovibrionaceae bacterium]|nr:hypothetical protein [Pseudobdellovibrionaceae bacterium]